MLYPPKKRAYSPENKKTKELSNLMNINSKFTGSGGSTTFVIKILPLLLQRNAIHFLKHLSQESSKLISTHLLN